MTLHDFCRQILSNQILNEWWQKATIKAGIDPTEWPEGPLKAQALEWQRVKNEKGVKYAAVHFSSLITDSGAKLDLPQDPELLGEMYRHLLLTYRAQELGTKLKDDPTKVEQYMSEFKKPRSKRLLRPFHSTMSDVGAAVIKNANSKEPFVKIKRWPVLSEAVGGFNPGRVGMIVASTGFGKSTLALNLAVDASEDKAVGYYNMEMIDQDFGEKIYQKIIGVQYKELKSQANKYIAEMGEAYLKMQERRFYTSDGRAVTSSQIESDLVAITEEDGPLNLVVVDYDQKIILDVSRDMPEWKALQITVEKFESLAKQLNCYILILAQQNADEGVSGSRRSTFPVSTVMRFHKDEEKYIITLDKNRFGKAKQQIEVEYHADRSIVTELGIVTTEPRVQKRIDYGDKPIKRYNPGGD